MEKETTARIIKGVGGLYTVLTEHSDGTMPSPSRIDCRAKGLFRHSGITPLAGDRVRIAFEERAQTKKDGGGAVITQILERKNALIRPPIANLDYLFVTMAVTSPQPILLTTDKLTCIAEFNHIEPVIVIGKCELDREGAEALASTYRLAGFSTFVLSCREGIGIEPLADFIRTSLPGKIAAFAGASGVGKSTLLNRLFPTLHLQTSQISRKIERGKNTTRTVELFPIAGSEDAYIADTPGFSMLDFEHFDFFTKDDLPFTMREFDAYLGQCRYTKCTHTKEEGCAVLQAVRKGEIAPSRHESYRALFEVLKAKPSWKNNEKET